MAKITAAITRKRFELVKDRIAFILADELASQADLNDDTLFDAPVWLSRYIPINIDEYPCINVQFGRLANDSYNVGRDQRNTCTYFIDVYTKEKSTTANSGDKLANAACERLMGVIASILMSPYYIRLNFETTKFISYVRVSDIDLQEPENNQDTAQTAKGRVTLEVQMVETVEQLTAEESSGTYSVWTIGTSDKGFLITKLN